MGFYQLCVFCVQGFSFFSISLEISIAFVMSKKFENQSWDNLHFKEQKVIEYFDEAKNSSWMTETHKKSVFLQAIRNKNKALCIYNVLFKVLFIVNCRMTILKLLKK